MARSITAIKNSITSEYIANESIKSIYSLDENKSFDEQFSIVSFESILFGIIAIAIFILESLFDNHKTEVETELSFKKPHSEKWYRQKALDFQYGFDLITDSDLFNNSGFTADQITASKIIKYSAVRQAVSESVLVLKIATETDGELSPISSSQLEAFNSYIDEIKDAGVAIRTINFLPDILKLTMKIYRDALVLDQNGVSRIDGTKPVELAILNYLKNLPFNGELVLFDLQEYIKQNAPGVIIPQIIKAETKWIDVALDDYGNFENINVRKIPVSGYFKNQDFLNIEYVV